jgi:hypothetical protein
MIWPLKVLFNTRLGRLCEANGMWGVGPKSEERSIQPRYNTRIVARLAWRVFFGVVAPRIPPYRHFLSISKKWREGVIGSIHTSSFQQKIFFLS